MIPVILMKYKKELAIAAVIGVMALSILFLNLRVDALESKLETKELELAIVTESHEQCKSSVTRQNEALQALKSATEETKAKAGQAVEASIAVRASKAASTQAIKGQALIQSCEQGMDKLLEELL